jgi:hypothetical protein
MENIILLISLFFSHYIVDYTPIGNAIEVQNNTYRTLIIHSLIHSFVLGIITIGYSYFIKNINSEIIIYSILIQLLSHYLIDLCVGIINKYYPKVETKTMQSLILGVDQFLHSIALIVIYFIINQI